MHYPPDSATPAWRKSDSAIQDMALLREQVREKYHRSHTGGLLAYLAKGVNPSGPSAGWPCPLPSVSPVIMLPGSSVRHRGLLRPLRMIHRIMLPLQPNIRHPADYLKNVRQQFSVLPKSRRVVVYK